MSHLGNPLTHQELIGQQPCTRMLARSKAWRRIALCSRGGNQPQDPEAMRISVRWVSSERPVCGVAIFSIDHAFDSVASHESRLWQALRTPQTNSEVTAGQVAQAVAPASDAAPKPQKFRPSVW